MIIYMMLFLIMDKKVVADEEVLEVLRILEKATEVAKEAR